MKTGFKYDIFVLRTSCWHGVTADGSSSSVMGDPIVD